MNLGKMTLVSVIALTMTSTAIADDKDIVVGNPMQLGDEAMSCEALVTEAGNMQAALGGAPDGSLLGSQVATSLATEAAVRSGMASKMGGKVGGAMKMFGKKKKKKAAAKRVRATGRYFYIAGLYAGKQCGMAKAEPAAAAEEAPTAEADASES